MTQREIQERNKQIAEIQERNKQIALMLGLKPLTKPYLGCYEPTSDTSNPSFYHERIEGESWYVYPEYDSDWNWLHEAVEFIEKLNNYFIQIEEKSCYVYDISKFDNSQTNAFIIKDGKTKKEAVFIAVSDFAKLYNEKKL